MLHAEALVVDNAAQRGARRLDSRSLGLDLEVKVAVLDTERDQTSSHSLRTSRYRK